MNRIIANLPVLCAAACLTVTSAGAHSAAAAPAAPAAAAWQAMKPKDVKAKVLVWLDAQPGNPAAKAKVQALWADTPGDLTAEECLRRLAVTLAAFDARAAKLVDRCSQSRREPVVSTEEWLRRPGTPALFSDNLRLYYARWLVSEALYEEASDQIQGLEPANVVDPASLLFCQGVVAHALLHRDVGLKALDELLRRADSSPKRYVAVARLMREDLKSLQEGTLDHIARRMEEIGRRLDLGRAGPKVRKVEDGVIESLDKLIKKIEDQQQQQSASSAGALTPSSPAKDSYLRDGKAPGQVTKKNIGSGSGWGDLPPKQREEAMQQIGRDFPSHYREVIEQYYRRLASEGSKQPDPKKE